MSPKTREMATFCRHVEAGAIAKIVGNDVKLVFDASKPDGIPRTLMDSECLHGLGKGDARSPEDGTASTYL